MSSLREAQKELTRHRLVEAARDVFTGRGYGEVTVDDIVERAGASRGTFYLYFKSKGEVLAEIFSADFVEPVLRLFDDIPATPVTGARVRRWIVEFIDVFESHRWTMRAWLLADTHDPAVRRAATAMTDSVLDRLGSVLADRRGTSTAAGRKDARVTAFLLFAQLEQYCLFTSLRNYSLDKETALKVLSRQWERELNRSA